MTAFHARAHASPVTRNFEPARQARPGRDAVSGRDAVPGRYPEPGRDPESAAGHALAGCRVLIGRPAARANDLAAILGAWGAAPVQVPLLATHSEIASAAWLRATGDLAAGRFDWVAFTSAAAVAALADVGAQAAAGLLASPEAGTRRGVASRTRVAAVGPATAAALADAGIRVDLAPREAGSAATLADAWPTEPAGCTVLLPQSDRALPHLCESLCGAGYVVTPVCAYRTVTLPVPPATALELERGDFDAVLLTSPSMVEALAAVPIAAGTRLIAIGPTTAQAVISHGLDLAAQAPEPTARGLISALLSALLPVPSGAPGARPADVLAIVPPARPAVPAAPAGPAAPAAPTRG